MADMARNSKKWSTAYEMSYNSDIDGAGDALCPRCFFSVLWYSMQEKILSQHLSCRKYETNSYVYVEQEIKSRRKFWNFSLYGIASKFSARIEGSCQVVEIDFLGWLIGFGQVLWPLPSFKI